MRRVVLEFPTDKLETRRAESISEKIESLEMLQLLRSDGDEYTAICRMEFKITNCNLEELLAHSSLTDLQLIDKEKGGAFIVYIKGRQPNILSNIVGPMARSAGV